MSAESSFSPRGVQPPAHRESTSMPKNHLHARGLRILMFGTTGSGKTSLLGALWQAAQSQEAVLGGKISNPTGGLEKLHEHVYSQQPYETDEDMTGYPVSLEPTKGDTIDAVLIDTDGRIAEEHLSQKEALAGKSKGAKAVNSADALIFLVDPTKGGAHFEKEFQQFCTFVENLEKMRSHRTEVAGLPIYLVLTKVDAYGKPTDPTGAWVQKIEDAKRKIDKKFQDVEAKFPYPDNIPFGKADVRIWATSVKRPPLADKPTKSQEPYGVAELFRQCLESARDFHDLRRKSRSKLQLIILGSLLLLSAMVGAGGLFLAIRPSADITMLEASLRDALPGFPRSTSTDRLKEPREERLTKLEQLTKNPTYVKLSAEQKDDVSKAMDEIKKYVELSTQFQKEVRDPKFAKDEDDLKNIERDLGLVQIPEAYEKVWEKTTLAKNLQQRQKDVDLVRAAVKSEEEWFRAQIEDGKKLRSQFKPIDFDTASEKERAVWDAWYAQYKEYIKRSARFKELDRLDKSSSVTYRTVYRFRSVEQARIDLRKMQESLESLVKAAG